MKVSHIVSAVVLTIMVALVAIFIIDRRSNKIIIEGQIIGLDSEIIYIEKSLGEERYIVDSVKMSKIGEFRIRIDDSSNEHTLYELRCGWERVPILAKGGDRISINSLGRLSLNYQIEGGDESTLLQEFYQPYVRKSEDLKRILSRYIRAEGQGEDISAIAKEYNTAYNDIKRDQLRFIIANKESLAAIYALYQRLPGDTYLVSESSDVVYIRAVASAIEQRYPNSSYVDILHKTIEDYELRNDLISRIEYCNYPELEMSDIFGNSVKLSSLHGKLILLDFWSASQIGGEGNRNNAELKELYQEFQSQGFEIYQVGVETSRSLWIETIQQQRLPWISVSDMRGWGSTALGLYNVRELPANFLIDKEGNIVGRNLYGGELREAMEQYIE